MHSQKCTPLSECPASRKKSCRLFRELLPVTFFAVRTLYFSTNRITVLVLVEKHGIPSLVLIQQTVMSQFGNKFAVKPSRLTEVSKHLPHIVRTLRKNKFFRLRQLWSISAIIHVCHVRTGQSFHGGFEIHSDNVGSGS